MSLRTAKAVIFIGFSGNGDYIIMKDLNSVTGLKEKAFFITKPDEDPTLVDTLEDYGTVCQIGVSGIADKIDEQLKEYIPSLIKTKFISFKESKLLTVNPTKTFIENQYVNALHTTGQFDPRLLILGSDGDYKLLLMRYQVKCIVNSIKTKKEICLYIIHAFLGNGKTIALKMIEHQLLLDDISVYMLSNETDITLREVEEMCASNQKMVILFENFYAHEKSIKMFTSQPSGQIALVSTARTPVYESKIASLEDMMKSYIFCEYDINSFSRNNGEIEKLIDIFDANAL